MHTFFIIVITITIQVAAIAIVKFYNYNKTVENLHLYPTLDIMQPNSIKVPHVTYLISYNITKCKW